MPGQTVINYYKIQPIFLLYYIIVLQWNLALSAPRVYKQIQTQPQKYKLLREPLLSELLGHPNCLVPRIVRINEVLLYFINQHYISFLFLFFG